MRTTIDNLNKHYTLIYTHVVFSVIRRYVPYLLPSAEVTVYFANKGARFFALANTDYRDIDERNLIHQD